MTGIERLRAYQAATGITQEELARRLGVSAQLVYYWYRGERTPGLQTATEIERLTGGAIPTFVWLRKRARRRSV